MIIYDDPETFVDEASRSRRTANETSLRKSEKTSRFPSVPLGRPLGESVPAVPLPNGGVVIPGLGLPPLVAVESSDGRDSALEFGVESEPAVMEPG